MTRVEIIIAAIWLGAFAVSVWFNVLAWPRLARSQGALLLRQGDLLTRQAVVIEGQRESLDEARFVIDLLDDENAALRSLVTEAPR